MKKPSKLKRHSSLVGIEFKSYKISNHIMGQLDDLRKHGRAGPHAYVRLLLGPTGIGKSALLKKYVEQFPESRDADGNVKRRILLVEAPEKCTTKGLAEQILRALGDDAPTVGTEGAMISRIVEHVALQDVEMIIIDEGQQLTGADGFVVGNFFKALVNQTKRPIVISGLPSLENLKGMNKQFGDRCRSDIVMARYDWHSARGKATIKLLLAALEDLMMFDIRDFHLDDDAFAERMAFASLGILRPMINVVLEAEAIGREDDLTELGIEHFAEGWARLNPGEARNPFTDAIPDIWPVGRDDEGDRERARGKPRK